MRYYCFRLLHSLSKIECVDLERGGRRTSTRMARDLRAQLDTMHPIAPQEGLSQACLDRIEQAERVVPTMPAPIACVSG